MVEYGYPGQGNFFEDDKVKVANAPGRDPGGIVAYEYEQRSPSLPHRKDLVLPDRSSAPQSELHARASSRLHLRHGLGAQQRNASHRPRTPTLALGDERHSRHRSQPCSPSPLRVRAGWPHDRALHRPQHSGGDRRHWQSIGEWYQTLSKDRLVATPEIAAKANELAAGKTDFYDKTEAIAEFVQKAGPLLRHRDGHRRLSAPLRRRHLPQSLRRLQRQGHAALRHALDRRHPLRARHGRPPPRRRRSGCAIDRRRPHDRSHRDSQRLQLTQASQRRHRKDRPPVPHLRSHLGQDRLRPA